MPEQELDLLQLSAGEMTQAGATAAEVVRSQVCDVGAPGRALNNMPYRFRRDMFAPDRPGSADRPKDEPGRYSGSVHPVIHRAFHPVWHWNRSDVLAFANQVGYNPVVLPDLQVGDPEPNQLRAPEAAADQNRQNSPIAFPAETIWTGCAQQRAALIRRQPVSDPYSQPLCAPSLVECPPPVRGSTDRHPTPHRQVV